MNHAANAVSRAQSDGVRAHPRSDVAAPPAVPRSRHGNLAEARSWCANRLHRRFTVVPTSRLLCTPRLCEVVGVRRGRSLRRLARLIVCAVLVVPAACSVRVRTPEFGPAQGPPRLIDHAWITADGTRLPVTRWLPEGRPRGVVLALHGFGEHRNAFFTLGPALAAAGYALYAYDQRGFGETPHRGLWPGQDVLIDDARAAWRLLRRHYPETPVYLLGHSMGGAVAALAVTGPGAIHPASTVLVAPAVHGWGTLPWIQEAALVAGAWIAPGARPQQSSAHHFVDIRITDDRRILALQARDEQILRAVRLDMVYALVDMMSAAVERIDALPPATLILYGEKDDLVPRSAACAMLARLADRAAPRPRLALYDDGYHYLLRDRQRPRTIADLVAWLGTTGATLPSGAALPVAQGRERLCR